MANKTQHQEETSQTCKPGFAPARRKARRPLRLVATIQRACCASICCSFSPPFAVYSQVRHFDFVNFDDPEYITENNHVRRRTDVERLVWASFLRAPTGSADLGFSHGGLPVLRAGAAGGIT